MKGLLSFCIGIAVIIGGSVNTAFSCGGQAGGVGCRVATMPLTVEDAVWVIRWIGFIIP